MTMNHSRWTRRAWLGGAALGAGAVLLPYADRLVAEARGATEPRKRVIFVVEGNGWFGWKPETDGDRITALSSSMAPLTPYLSQMLIADGLQLLDGGGHSHSYTGMSCAPSVGPAQMPSAATIDQELGAMLGESYPWRTLQFAANHSLALDKSCLATDRMRPVASIGNPRTALSSTFGLAGIGDGEALVARRRRLLDVMHEDSAQIRSRLAGPEREKIEQVLFQIESMEQRITHLQANAEEITQCQQGVAPIADPTPFALDSVEERSVAFFDLAAQLIICGLTPVVTLQSATGLGSFGMMYEGLGYTIGKHGLGHGGVDPVAGHQDTIHAFYASLIRALCDRLAAAPEGDGSVLDNTLIVWLNENGTAHHSRPWHPYVGVVVGGRNSGLRLDGRYHDFEQERSWADFYNTIGHAVGVPLDEFGQLGTTPLQGPLESLLA